MTVIKCEGVDEKILIKKINKIYWYPADCEKFIKLDFLELCSSLACKYDSFDITLVINGVELSKKYDREEDFKEIYNFVFGRFKVEQKEQIYDPMSSIINKIVNKMNKLIYRCFINNDIDNLKWLIKEHPLAFRRYNNIVNCIYSENFEAFRLIEPLYIGNDSGRLIKASLRVNTPIFFKHFLNKYKVDLNKLYKWLKMSDHEDWEQFIITKNKLKKQQSQSMKSADKGEQ